MDVVKPVTRKILLNPGPGTTSDTVKYAQVVPDICPREKEFVDLMSGVRRDLLAVVHADPADYAAVIFTGSGTICQDVCVNSLVPAGAKLLVVNNGAYAQRMVDIAAAYGIDCVNLAFPSSGRPDPDAVRAALAGDPAIAVVAAVHHETGTGVLNPIREIGKIAHAHDCPLVVDTISTYGLRPIDIAAENIDVCMSSAQKGLMGMTGASWVIGRRSLIAASEGYPRRSYYCNLFRQYDYFERVGEMHFTPPVQVIYALRQALDEYFAEGEKNRWKRIRGCWSAIHRGIADMGLRPAVDPALQGGVVVAVNAPADDRFDFDTLHDHCYARGFTIYPGKIDGEATFRLCCIGQIDSRDIAAFFEVARDAFERMGFILPLID